MITRSELLKSEEYWTEIIQLKLYNDIVEFVEESGLSNKEIARKIGVSKGRVSQILSGKNLNLRIDSLVKISLAINKVPNLYLEDIDRFINKDTNNKEGAVFTNDQDEIPIVWGIIDNFTNEIPKGQRINIPSTPESSMEDLSAQEFVSGTANVN